VTVAQRSTPALRPRSNPLTRRIGYAVAVAVNLALLLLTIVWPGWQVVPFLTPAAAEVIPVFVASLIAGMAVNLVNLITDSSVLWSMGEIVGAIFAFAVALRLWQVFPFDFGSSTFDWTLLVRALLVLAMVGCLIAVVAHVVRLIRLASGGWRSQ
jgi:hypothetical protein